MRSAVWIPALIAGMVWAGACADSGLGPEQQNLSTADAADLVADIDAMTGEIILGKMLIAGFGLGDGLAVNAGDVRSFSRERACPLGGKVTVSGEIERTRHADGVVEFNVSANGTKTDCARKTRNDLTLTVNGTFSLEAYRKQVNGQPVGLQTTTKKGHFEWARSDGKTGACDFEITSVRNPDAGKRTVKGTVCGRVIDREFSWKRSEG